MWLTLLLGGPGVRVGEPGVKVEELGDHPGEGDDGVRWLLKLQAVGVATFFASVAAVAVAVVEEVLLNEEIVPLEGALC